MLERRHRFQELHLQLMKTKTLSEFNDLYYEIDWNRNGKVERSEFVNAGFPEEEFDKLTNHGEFSKIYRV